MIIAMSRFKRVSREDLTSSGAAPRWSDVADEGTVLVDSTAPLDALVADPANVEQDKSRANWWLPADVESWWDIPEPPAGEPMRETPLTVEQLMRREREFHLFGRGAGGKHLPDHSARLIAFILDGAMHGAVLFLGYRALNSAYPNLLPAVQVKAVAALAAWVLLSLVPLLLWRATPGKLLLGLRLVRANGDEASAGQAIMRGTVMLLAPLAVPDMLVVLMSPHRRRLIDYVTGTRVVANS